MGADSRPTTPKSILRRAVPSRPTDGSQRKRVTFEEGIWNEKSGLCRVPKPMRHGAAGVGIPRRSRIDARDMNLASSVQTLILGGCGLPSSSSSGALRAGPNARAVGGTNGRGGRAARMAAAAMAVGLNPVSKTASGVDLISRGREGGVSSAATSKSGTAKYSRNPKAAGLIVDRRGRHTALVGKLTAVSNETAGGGFSREGRHGQSSAGRAVDDSTSSALGGPTSGEPKGVCVPRTKSCGSTPVDGGAEGQASERDQAQATADDHPRPRGKKNPEACLSFPEGSQRGEGSGAADDSSTSEHEARRDKECGTVTAESETTESAAACVSGVVQDRLNPVWIPPRPRLSPVAQRVGWSGDVADEASDKTPDVLHCKPLQSLDGCKSVGDTVPVTVERREHGSRVEPGKSCTARCKVLNSSAPTEAAVHPDHDETVTPACGSSAEDLEPNRAAELTRLQSLDDTASGAEVMSYSPTSVPKPEDDSRATGRTPSRAKQEVVIVTPPSSESSMESPFSPPSGGSESLPCKFDREDSTCRAAGGDADTSKLGGARYAGNAPGHDTRRARCRRAGLEIPKVPSIAWEESNVGPGDTIPADALHPSPAVMSAPPGLGNDVVDESRANDTVDAPSIAGKDQADDKHVGDSMDGGEDPPIPRSCCSSADAGGDGGVRAADGPRGVSQGGHDSEENRGDDLGAPGFSSSAAGAAGVNSPPPRDGVQESGAADDQLGMDHGSDGGADGARDQGLSRTMEKSPRDGDVTKNALRDRSSCNPGVDRSEKKTARKRARGAPRADDSGEPLRANANSPNTRSSEVKDAPGEALCAPISEELEGTGRDAAEPSSGRDARDDEGDPVEAEVEAGDAMGAPEGGAEKDCGVACVQATGVAEEDGMDWEDLPLGEALKRLGKRRSPGSDVTRDNDAEEATLCDGDASCPPLGCNPASRSTQNGVTCTETATDIEEIQDSSLVPPGCEDADERRQVQKLEDKVEEVVTAIFAEADSACDNKSNAAGLTGRGTSAGTVADYGEGRTSGDEVIGGETHGGCTDGTGTEGAEGCVPVSEVDWEDLPLGEAMRQLRMKRELRSGDAHGDSPAPASSGDSKDAANFKDRTETTVESTNHANHARDTQVLGTDDVSCPTEHAEDHAEKVPDASTSGVDGGEALTSDGSHRELLLLAPVKLEPCVELGRRSLRARARSLSPSCPRKSQRISQASESDGWHSDSSGGVDSSNAESSVSIILVVPGSSSGEHPPSVASFISSRTRNKRQRQEMEKEEKVKDTQSPFGGDDSASRKRQTRSAGLNLIPAMSLPEASRRRNSSSRRESVLEDDEKAWPAVPPAGAPIAGSAEFSRGSSGEVCESWKIVAPDVKDGGILGDRKAVPLGVRGWMEPAYRFAVGLRLGQRRATTGSAVDDASVERLLSCGAATGASVCEIGAGEFVTRQKSALGSGVWGWMKPMTRLVARVDE